MTKKSVLLVGASGSMGHEAFKELMRRMDCYDLVLLLLPQPYEKKLFSCYENISGIKIIWGDLTKYKDVLEAVKGVDYVLNAAAFISPAADKYPKKAMQVNYGGTVNLINAIKAQPCGGENIKFVGIGSVAEIGDRLDTIHMARCGDPLKPSIFDLYAISKIRAERYVIESGLKHWVWLRQTYIAIPDTLSLLAPIMYHQPIETKIEFVTARDAGYLLAQICEDDVPDEFWRKIYNIGGGPSCRVVYLEYMQEIFKMLGMGDCCKLFNRNWFALKNFHCAYWDDSNVLNAYLHFQRDTKEDYYQQVLDAAPWYVRLVMNQYVSKLIPKILLRYCLFWPLARFSKQGTLYWIKNNVEDRISAFFGSKKKWEAIPDWGIDMPDFAVVSKRLDHGYDETKEKLEIEDLQGAAKFRGGELLSQEWNRDMYVKLKWRCVFGHEFEASPYLVLKTGQWCPDCDAPPWKYDEIAKKNPFFAQVWYTNHDRNESNYYNETSEYRD